MASPAGLNHGYLFGIGKPPYKDHVYVTRSQHPFDPFTNPNLCRAFDEADIIVSERGEPSSEQELKEFFQTFPERLQKALSPEDLQTLKNDLFRLLNQMPVLKTFDGYPELESLISQGGNDAAAITSLILFGIANIITLSEKRVAELSSGSSPIESITSRASLLSKQIVPLSLSEETPKMTQLFSLLLEEPELLRAILFAFTREDIGILLSDTHALERGCYEDTSIPDMVKEKLLRAIFLEGNFDLQKLENLPIIRTINSLFSLPNMAEKIRNFVEADKRHLFFISPETLDEWPLYDLPLTQIKIPLKPVGFFWTIQDSEGHEGFLMGSMHLTAEKLVNFPNEILDRFDRSVIAVEIDVTREDVIKQSAEVSWETWQAKELDLLSPAEKEELAAFLKSQYSDMEIIPMDEFDLETQFLLQALHKFAVQGLSTVLSSQRDKNTNQSFLKTGIERTLIQRARERQIPIKDLETFEDHFINFSPRGGYVGLIPIFSYKELMKLIETSRMSLEEAATAHLDHSHGIPTTLDELYESMQKPLLQKMTDMMESGDLDALEVEYLSRDPAERPGLIQRNQNMALKIDEFMKSGSTHFCIAGALHMVGPSSIPSLLREAGYRVERRIIEEPLEAD